MVVCSFRSTRWSAGLLIIAACAMLLGQGFSSFGDDPKSTDSKPIPKTARAEAGAAKAPNAQNIPAPPIDEKHPLYLPLQEAYKAREQLEAVKDYQCEFKKRELIGRKLMTTTMALKLRQEPFGVYLKFMDANAGREVIFVQGRNKDRQGNDQLKVHEVGIGSILGTIDLLPTCKDAMNGNKYPVTMIGLKTMLDKIIGQWETEGKLGEIKTQKYPNAVLPSGEACVAYESMHPTPRNQFPFHITRLWIDKETGLAIRVEQLGFPQKGDKEPPILEEYTYSKLKTNVPLGERDFDIKNPAYAFP